MKDLLMMDPENLLEVDRANLYEDSRELGKAAPHDQRYWIASVESASSLHAMSVITNILISVLKMNLLILVKT